MFKKYTPLIFYIVMFFAVMAAAITYNSVDNDLFSRMMMGKHVLLTGQPMFHDVVSYTKTNIWYDHEWISSAGFYYIASHFGINGLIILKGLTFYITFVFMTLVFKERYPKLSPYSIGFFLIMLYTTINIKPMTSLIRCQQLTFMIIPLWILLLEKIRNGKNIYLYVLPPMMLLWANMHGAAIAALGILLFYGIGEALNKKPFLKYIVVFAVCCATFFINPWGPDYIKFMIDACFVDRTWIGEWQPPFKYVFQFLLMYKVMALLLPVFSMLNIWRNDFNYNKIDKVKFIVTWAFCLISIAHIKHIWPYCLIFTMFFFDDIYFVYNKIVLAIKDKFKISDNFAQKVVTIKNYLIYEIVLIVSIVVMCVTSPYQSAWGDFKESFPVDAMNFILFNKIEGKVLATYFHSGFVSYKGYPQVKIFMDGREEQLYPDEYINLSMKFFNWSEEYPDEILLKYRPDIILSDNTFTATYQEETLKKEFDFEKVYSDEHFTVFVDKKIKKKTYYKPFPSESVYLETLFETNVMGSKN